MVMSNSSKSRCYGCGEQLRSATLLVCADCLGEESQIFLNLASEEDVIDLEEHKTEDKDA